MTVRYVPFIVLSPNTIIHVSCHLINSFIGLVAPDISRTYQHLSAGSHHTGAAEDPELELRGYITSATIFQHKRSFTRHKFLVYAIFAAME